MERKIALVTGAASGLGLHVAEELRMMGYDVLRYDLAFGQDVLTPVIDSDKLDVLVNCAGVNGINWLDDVTEDEFDKIIDVNVKGVFLMSQAAAPLLRESKGTILNIVSNAAHMPMRCSAAYNASKGAALMLTKQLARELAPDVTVFSVSPNKLSNTGMSNAIDEQVVRTRGWTMKQAKDYQINGMLTGEETPPEVVAEFIGFLLCEKENHKYLAGCDLPYGA